MQYYLLLLLFAISTITSAQDDLNIELISIYPTNEFTNDVWGYQHEDGTEYAILGRRSGTSVVSLKDPTNPKRLSFISGASSTWRDMKTVGDYAYVVADQGTDGLLIINMTHLPDSTSHEFVKPNIVIDGQEQTLNRCHNIYADEDGFLYLSGCDVSARGVLILDTKDNPMNPTFVGIADRAYAHDAFVRDGMLFASEIFNGSLGIYDITDKENPKFLAEQRTSSSFTHNAWSSDDNSIVFTTDERENAFLDAYDISNLDEIKLLDKFKPLETENRDIIPHNTHYIDGFLVTSWYTDGVVIIDAHRPDNLIKVGQYDTFKGSHGGFNGCWGTTPYLPSGLILASDINSGLYVLQPDYKRACYLEGMVTSKVDGKIIVGAEINILSNDKNNASTDPSGVYKTGQASSGTFQAVARHPEFFTDTITVDLFNGEVTAANFTLNNKIIKTITGTVTDIESGEVLSNAKVLIQSETEESRGPTDANGSYFIDILPGDIQIIAGRLGYKTVMIKVDSSANQVDFQLERGLMDDFNFDYSWTTSGDATTGLWVRDIPKATMLDGNFANPNEDIDSDIGGYAYVTGNLSEVNGSSGAQDVDDGTAVLTSPVFDLSDMSNPTLSYSAWFFNQGGNSPPNDKMTISLIAGEEKITIENITADSSSSHWKTRSNILIKDFVSALSSIQLEVKVSDLDPGHVVEAGFDGLEITNNKTTATEELGESLVNVEISPNPVLDLIHVNSKELMLQIKISQINGQVIYTSGFINEFNTDISLSNMASGVYVVDILFDNNQRIIKKVVKAEN